MVKRSQIKRLAKRQLKRNWGIALGAIPLCAAMSVAALIIGGPALANVVAVGFAAAYMAIIRTGKAKISSIFEGWQSFGPAFIAGILVPLYTCFWSMLFGIPGIIKSYAYAMTNYVIKDNPDMTAKEAITESRRLMRGNKWRLFIMDLSFIWWDILCVLTLGILLIYVVPFKLAARAAFYDAVKSSKEAKQISVQPEVPAIPEAPEASEAPIAPEAPAAQPVFVPYTAPAQAEPVPSTYAPEPEATDAE